MRIVDAICLFLNDYVCQPAGGEPMNKFLSGMFFGIVLAHLLITLFGYPMNCQPEKPPWCDDVEYQGDTNEECE